MEISICHLYPDVLNLYGDRGNILCLRRRLEWRGIGCRVDHVRLGETRSLAGYDLFFIGGGQDFDQEVLLEDLRSKKGPEILAALDDGKTFLCICGGYQMMGHYYETADGQKCEFLGAIDFHTVGGRKRMIGNYAFELGQEAGGTTVVGFENHSGRTLLAGGVAPLGTVLRGYGNNGRDRTEGAHYKNAFCTYSHGPVLPKNPAFADHLIRTALVRKYGDCDLEPIDDTFEETAHDAMCRRLLKAGKTDPAFPGRNQGFRLDRSGPGKSGKTNACSHAKRKDFIPVLNGPGSRKRKMYYRIQKWIDISRFKGIM